MSFLGRGNIPFSEGLPTRCSNGRYAKDINFNAFVAAFLHGQAQIHRAFHIDAPRTGEHGGRTAASTAAPMIKEIIGRAAPLLGVRPRFGPAGDPYLLADY
jgi:cell division protein FtsI (penicillin-binding protein 3)